MPMFTLGLSLFANAIKVINLTYLIEVPHLYRVQVTSGMMLVGFGLMSYAVGTTEVYGFYLALFAAILTGWSAALGEVTILGVLKFYPADFIFGYSSGGGMAGIVGSGVILWLRSIGIDDQSIFMCGIPAIIVYYLSANLLIQTIKKSDYSSKSSSETGNAKFSLRQFKFVFARAKVYYLNLVLIHLLSYVIIT